MNSEHSIFSLSHMLFQAATEQHKKQMQKTKAPPKNCASLKKTLPDSPGARIAYLRRKYHMTQACLADAVGISAAALSRYENNTHPFGIDLLLAFCQELHTSPDFLLGLTNNPRTKHLTVSDASNTSDIVPCLQDMCTSTTAQASFKQPIYTFPATLPEYHFFLLLRSLPPSYRHFFLETFSSFFEYVTENPAYLREIDYYIQKCASAHPEDSGCAKETKL